MKPKEPKLKDCANESCDNQFRQFNSTVKVCSMECAIVYAKKTNQDKAIKEAEQDKRQYDLDKLTVDGYRAKYIQPLINHIARIIDHEQPCIASKVPYGKRNGGHFHSVSSNRTIAMNLHNVHIQMEQSNNHQGGDQVKYRHGLIDIYGKRYSEYVDMHLMQCPNLHLTKDDLITAKPILEAIKRKYLKLGLIYTPKQRMRLRDQLNEEIGLYTDEFASFAYFQQSKKNKPEDKSQLNLGL